MPKVEITAPAKADIQEAYDWWSDNRSAVQSAEWYESIFEAIATLQKIPERCPHVPEAGLSRVGVRHASHKTSGIESISGFLAA